MQTLETGRAIKQRQLDIFEQRDAEFLNRCRQIAVAHAQQHGTVSINDVRQLVELPPDMHPSVLGAVFKGKQFKAVGFTEANHIAAHGRVVRVYQLKEQGDTNGWKTH